MVFAVRQLIQKKWLAQVGLLRQAAWLTLSVVLLAVLSGCNMPTLVQGELPTLVPNYTATPAPTLNFATATAAPTTAPDVPTATPEPARSAQCPASPPQRVDVGMQARVTITDGTPLRVRTQPVVTNNNILLQLPEGAPFEIIGGPSCWESSTNNFTFWQIRMADGQIGWVAEGTPSGYFIEPLP